MLPHSFSGVSSLEILKSRLGLPALYKCCSECLCIRIIIDIVPLHELLGMLQQLTLQSEVFHFIYVLVVHKIAQHL